MVKPWSVLIVLVMITFSRQTSALLLNCCRHNVAFGLLSRPITRLFADQSRTEVPGRRVFNMDESLLRERRPNYGECVLFGIDALDRLVAKANYSLPPTTSKPIFITWAREICKRKLQTDVEFRERVKVRELRRQHAVEINDMELALLQSKNVFEAHQNYETLSSLDRSIRNGQQAIASMEKLLRSAESIGNEDEQMEAALSSDEQCSIASASAVEEYTETTLSLKSTTSETTIVESAESAVMTSTKVVPPLLAKRAAKARHVAEIYPLKKQEVQRSIEERDFLRAQTPEYFDYENNVQALLALYDRIGLSEAVKHVTSVQKGAGQGRNSRGRNFENTADSVLSEHLLPLLAEKHGCDVSDLLIVRNIKLGMASSKGSTAELDSLICVRAERPARLDSYKPRGSFCKVLAVVEVKRNPDDIGEAFVGYQKSLAWLAGLQSLYDPSAWRTKAYPTGHFHDRLFLQDWNGESLIFTTESFAELKRDIVRLPSTSSGLAQFVVSEVSAPQAEIEIGGSAAITSDVTAVASTVESDQDTSDSRCYSMFVNGLYFVTKDGSLDSVHSKAMCWAINKVAGEKEFDMDLSDEEAVENLRLRVEERYPHRVSTLDVIDVYKQCGLYGQVFVVCDERWQQNNNNNNNSSSISNSNNTTTSTPQTSTTDLSK